MPRAQNTGTGRRLAALDLGTNSSLFLLAQVDNCGRIHPLRHEVRTNDLGRGLDKKGFLTPEVIELNLRLLREFQSFALAGQAPELRIAATEALRQAQNAPILIQRAQAELGLEIKVLSSEREAELTFQGVVSGLVETQRKVLVADVGGGSTELVIGEGAKVFQWVSLPLGAVSLARTFILHDPPLPEELQAIRARLQTDFANLSLPLTQKGIKLIICGGTASTLASAALKLERYQPEKLSGYRLTRARLERLLTRFAAATLEQRRQIPGVGFRRAEIILPGTMIIEALLHCSGRASYWTSERGLRYGMLLVPSWS